MALVGDLRQDEVSAILLTLVVTLLAGQPSLINNALSSVFSCSKTGGSGGGTIRFKEELAHGGNAGLAETAVPWLEPIYKKYDADGLSYADLYTLGGGKLLLNDTSVDQSAAKRVAALLDIHVYKTCVR